MTSSLTTEIVVAGVGLTPVGEHWDQSLRQLALRAIEAARADAGGLRPDALYVANMLAPALSGQAHLGALIADFAGLRGIEAMAVDAAGASGGAALRQAWLAIASGQIGSALVVGVEKITDKVGAAIQAAMAASGDADYESVQGITPAAQAALVMRRYLHETSAPADALGGFSLVAHANAVHNPNAMFRRAIDREDYRKAAAVSAPVSVMDVAPLADGAAAIILTRRDIVATPEARPLVAVVGSALTTTSLALHDQADLLTLDAAAESARRAYAQAGVGPADIDLFELHDPFSIFAALGLEAAGFAEPRMGWTLGVDGAVSLTGRIPISTFGGSKARGEPGGATGVYQACEVVLQVEGRAGASQVAGARIGMSQCLGAMGATAATHIFARIPPK
jgi:acetyl-CoA C-acetyltransferase